MRVPQVVALISLQAMDCRQVYRRLCYSSVPLGVTSVEVGLRMQTLCYVGRASWSSERVEPAVSGTDAVAPLSVALHRAVTQYAYVEAAERYRGYMHPSKDLEAKDRSLILQEKVGGLMALCRRRAQPVRCERHWRQTYGGVGGAYREVVVAGCWI